MELLKVLVHDFHYNIIQNRYGTDRAKLLFPDTDSLCYDIKTEDVYRDMSEEIDYYNTSNYPPEMVEPWW